MSFFRVVATRAAPQSTSNYPHPPRTSYGLPVTRMSPQRKFPFSRGLIGKKGTLPSHKHPKHYLQLPCQLCAHCPIAQYEIPNGQPNNKDIWFWLMPSPKPFQSFQFSTVPPHETTHFTITTMTTGTSFSKEHSSEI